MPKEKLPNEPIKVTDRRIFTPDGEIRDEYKKSVIPSDEPKARPVPEPAATLSAEPASGEVKAGANQERKKKVRDKAANPGTPFSTFTESLVLNAYMSLGLLRNPYQPQVEIDLHAAQQMIDILGVLQDKTKGNLTEEEADFLATHLAELKLAYVRSNKGGV